MAIYDNVDEDSSESVSIRILDDNDDEVFILSFEKKKFFKNHLIVL